MSCSTYQNPWAGPVKPYAQFSPVLNHCGELGAAIWVASMYLISSSKAWASSGEAKYPYFSPQKRQVPASRSNTWRAERSGPVTWRPSSSRMGAPDSSY